MYTNKIIISVRDKCEKIRIINRIKIDFLKEGSLESLSRTALEAILDYEEKIKQIFIDNIKMGLKIEKIKELMKDIEFKLKIETIMKDLGIERFEDLSILLSDSLLNTLLNTLKPEGEIK